MESLEYTLWVCQYLKMWIYATPSEAAYVITRNLEALFGHTTKALQKVLPISLLVISRSLALMMIHLQIHLLFFHHQKCVDDISHLNIANVTLANASLVFISVLSKSNLTIGIRITSSLLCSMWSIAAILQYKATITLLMNTWFHFLTQFYCLGGFQYLNITRQMFYYGLTST